MQRQEQSGLIDVLILLNAQQTYLQAEIQVVQARAARLADTAALFQALGGGWWNRTEPPAEKVLDVSTGGTANACGRSAHRHAPNPPRPLRSLQTERVRSNKIYILTRAANSAAR